MGKIKVLSEELSNRIAAGEVVERPASVVKELVENSIDAGAGRVLLEIERFGTKTIRITDDGEGMDSDDLIMALEPHGTSKIKEDHDIESITTLGFRGEAIPSIASISNFSMCSRTAEGDSGNEIIVNGGKFISVGPVGCARGTRTTVRDLFFNIPARKKFLKSAATEENHIMERFLMMALPNPHIHFELSIDGKKVYHLPAGTLLARIGDTLGKDFASKLLPVDYTEGAFHIHGYIALPGYSRTNRREQRTFVNNRAVESNSIYRALKDGYEINESSRFHPCVLFVDLPPEMVDVNVHPAKREVRFKNDFLLTHVITRAIKDTLQLAPSPGSTLDNRLTLQAIIQGSEINYMPTERAEQEEFTELNITTGNEAPEHKSYAWLTDRHQNEDSTPFDYRVDFDLDIEMPSQKITVTQADLRQSTPAPEPSVIPDPSIQACSEQEDIVIEQVVAPQETISPGAKSNENFIEINEFLGFLNSTYILAKTAEGVVIIDQHAAHERVIYERLLKNIELATSETVASQKLLIPLTVELSRHSAAFIGKNSETFQKLGFDLDLLSSNTVIIEAIPPFLPSSNIEKLLLETCDELLSDSAVSRGISADKIAMAACKAAVKAKDRLTQSEAQALFKQLYQCRRPDICPHGRPTMLTVSLSEIERRIGRK